MLLGVRLAFVWSAAAGNRSLGSFGASTYGVDINNAGQTIGTGDTPMGPSLGFPFLIAFSTSID